MAGVTCADCGDDCKPEGGATGYAEMVDGRRVCYSCASAFERVIFSRVDTFCAYLAGDGRSVTTWPGGELARVTETRRHRGGFGGEWYSVRAVAPDGARWYGRGGGPGMLLRLRRCRA